MSKSDVSECSFSESCESESGVLDIRVLNVTVLCDRLVY